jgi:hypothetical protein
MTFSSFTKNPLRGVPWAWAYLPVNREVWDASVVSETVTKSSRTIASDASWSRFGVLTIGFP